MNDLVNVSETWKRKYDTIAAEYAYAEKTGNRAGYMSAKKQLVWMEAQAEGMES